MTRALRRYTVAAMLLTPSLVVGLPGSARAVNENFIYDDVLVPLTYPVYGQLGGGMGGGTSGCGGVSDHSGYDMLAKFDGYDAPVYAPYSGRVTIKGLDPTGWGNYVEIKHADNRSTVLAHLHDTAVVTGDYVATGQLIGYEGKSGAANGVYHVHMEIIDRSAMCPGTGIHLRINIGANYPCCQNGQPWVAAGAPIGVQRALAPEERTDNWQHEQMGQVRAGRRYPGDWRLEQRQL